MPSGADPLGRYVRSYAHVREAGSREWFDVPATGDYVVGVYRPGIPRRRWVKAEELPLVFDGGCSVVTVVFDVARDRVVSTKCNGVA